MRLTALILASSLASGVAAADPLAGFDAEAQSFTVSGLSSGGYMAVQLQVAHSKRVKGVAALAAGPYYCAQGSLWTAFYNCSTPTSWTPLPEVQKLKEQAERFAAEGRIDPLSNLAGTRLWFFSGTRDRTVERPVVEAAAQFYAQFGAKNIPLHRLAAGHAMVTMSAGTACGTTEPPFLNDCDFDAAGSLLRQLLGTLNPTADKQSGRLVAFDQKPFADGNAYAVSMADTGYAYIPAVCTSERCIVHVALHGCRQSAEAVGERFVRDAGYNRWADNNRLIVLYPQVVARYGFGYAAGTWNYVYNPRGCWDWWGYTDSQYATKSAPQIRAIVAMVERLGAPRK